ncbi:MAG: pyridoxal-phosphate-dependent aminotransferase family protein [Methanosarcina flavescens]|jgi:aspartate aminotransferase-like enzyme|uniref:Alanine--glyoxylate aminotransferase family protein n=1 Tax=Methanosarcina flavescens TaxID=1715806 RepID=A0A660HPK6_9EURY|nr:alanine--glyoxylate aminotransferase family protein [Methanosarcina flavescens]AYK14198.1 alanine--glyoxylate aminotransferase family protein [Methanosarcina flavescens]NLK33181.1 alanine--glyoxylate aminotransferase family protein [Methanosarcina flavescens]
MDLEDILLMMPGPVPVAPRVLRAMSKPMINHRSAEFAEIYTDCREILSNVFQTDNDIFLLSGSGTAGMEAAVGSLVGNGDKVIAIENGKFGERFKDIAALYADVVPAVFEWGLPIDLEVIKEKLEEGAKAITLVHNETSTGILNPAAEIGKLARKHDALFIMDGVTSIGGDNVRVDEWGVDIAVVGSQKCLAAPPGLSIVSVSEKALEAMKGITKRPYYNDLLAYKKSGDKPRPETPYTPAIPLFYALQEALHIVKEEGMDARIKRHRILSEAVRAAIAELNIEMFPQLNEYSHYSNTVSAMKAPAGIDSEDIKNDMKKQGVIIAGGQERLKSKIFRIGCMGNVTARDVLSTIQQLEIVLNKRGYIDSLGAGTEAAIRVIDRA